METQMILRIKDIPVDRMNIVIPMANFKYIDETSVKIKNRDGKIVGELVSKRGVAITDSLLPKNKLTHITIDITDEDIVNNQSSLRITLPENPILSKGIEIIVDIKDETEDKVWNNPTILDLVQDIFNNTEEYKLTLMKDNFFYSVVPKNIPRDYIISGVCLCKEEGLPPLETSMIVTELISILKDEKDIQDGLFSLKVSVYFTECIKKYKSNIEKQKNPTLTDALEEVTLNRIVDNYLEKEGIKREPDEEEASLSQLREVLDEILSEDKKLSSSEIKLMSYRIFNILNNAKFKDDDELESIVDELVRLVGPHRGATIGSMMASFIVYCKKDLGLEESQYKGITLNIIAHGLSKENFEMLDDEFRNYAFSKMDEFLKCYE